MEIQSIGNAIEGAKSIARSDKTQEESGFSNILSEAIEYIKETEAASDAATEALLTGDSDDIHTAMIAAQKAEIAVGYAVEIRNKLIQAYDEIMNMQV
jgi:flagellar hook-basal body complex protein FliE